MDKPTSASRYILTALAIILVITAFILVGLNALQVQKNTALIQSQIDAKYREGFLAARQKYQLICPQTALPQKAINGAITSISGNTLDIQTTNLDTDMTVDNLSDMRSVNITASTVIQKITRKDPAVLAAELQAFGQSKQPPTSPPPAPVTITTLQISQLQVGEKLTVSTLEDARTNGQLTALTISVE